MSAERWIVVRNWERHQHPDAARSSVPPWIKLYTELLSDEAYLGLTEARRAMLVGLWLEYARTRRRLPADSRSLSYRLNQRVRADDLDSLERAGFIEFSASEPASNPASNLASLEESRGDKDPLTPAERGNDASRNGPSLADGFAPETLETTVEQAVAQAASDASPCLVCGTPVRPGYRCPNCSSNPRAAGSSSRQTASRPRTTVFERACSYTRNEGWQYDLGAFRSDLDRFEGLTYDDRLQLEALREHLIDDHEALSW